MTATPLVWVVGSGGLLGTSVVRELGPDAWSFQRSLRWADAARLSEDLADAVRAFGARVRAEPERPWSVAWCAGAGIVGSSALALAAESAAFEQLLALVSADPTLSTRPGSVSLASSAGGVYGGSQATSIDELTPPEPISPYGHAKLEQERALANWLATQPNARALIARFSNLYGPAQRLDKAQGLISYISRCVIHGVPVHLYVSLETVRDYLFADDAGRGLVAGLRRIVGSGVGEPRSVTKIYASEAEVSIAGLLDVFSQISQRDVSVVSVLDPTAALQPPRLQFRSQVWKAPERRIELMEGVSRVYSAQQAMFRQGLLPAVTPQAAARAR